MVEKIPNVIMFIPIVCKKQRKGYKTALLSFGLTFSVEFFQYFIGRSSDIDDVITNLLGAVIGYMIFKAFHICWKDMKWWNKLLGDNS